MVRRRDLRPSGLRQSGTKRQSHGAPPTSLRGLTPPSLLLCEIPACHTPHVGHTIQRAASINRLPVQPRRANRHGEGQRSSGQSPRYNVRGSTNNRPFQPATPNLRPSTFNFRLSFLPPYCGNVAENAPMSAIHESSHPNWSSDGIDDAGWPKRVLCRNSQGFETATVPIYTGLFASPKLIPVPCRVDSGSSWQAAHIVLYQ